MEGGVQSALLQGERLGGDLPNPVGQLPTVLRAEGERLEDEEVERSLRQIEAGVVHRSLPFRFYRKVGPPGPAGHFRGPRFRLERSCGAGYFSLANEKCWDTMTQRPSRFSTTPVHRVFSHAAGWPL